MGEIVNLKRARKSREREAAKDDAATRRAKYGRTAEQKARDEESAARDHARLEGHRLDRSD